MQGRGLGTNLANSAVYKAQYSKLKVDNSAGVLRAAVSVAVPDSFDGHKKWKKYLRVGYQGSCGSCWGFATLTTLAARYALITGGHVAPKLSVGNIVVCNLGADQEVDAALEWLATGYAYDFTGKSERVGKSSVDSSESKHVGCDGETLINAWQYLYRFGVVEDSCMPYDELRAFEGDSKMYDISKWGDDPSLPYCYAAMGLSYDVCSTNTRRAAKYYRSGGYYIVPGVASQDPNASERSIRAEIYKFGPVATGFMVHTDFLEWDGKGIYKYNGSSKEQGGHAVVMVGWGTDQETGLDYWVCQNSWGDDWGDGGFFKIARGTNECQIEENVMTGFPDIPSIRLFLDWPIYYTSDDYTMRALWRVMDSGYKQTVYERMLSGELPTSAIPNSVRDAPLVPYTFWPDFNTFVAGKMNARFPLDNRVSIVTKRTLVGSVCAIAVAAIGIYALRRRVTITRK